MNKYKNSIDKINISESSKEKNKKLFQELEAGNDIHIKRRKFTPIALSVACIVFFVSIGLIYNYDKILQKMDSNISLSFTINTAAGELNENYATPALYGNGFNTKGISETADGSVCVNVVAPFTCNGENIKNITYSINKGCFQIVTSSDYPLIITDGQKYEGDVSDYPGGSIPNFDKTETIEELYYTEFTVDYENQTNEYTTINICEKSKLTNQDAITSAGSDIDVNEQKKCFDELYKDVVITCTVTYTDGTTEDKNIVVVNNIREFGEVIEEFYEYSTGKKYPRTGSESGWDKENVFIEYMLK